MHSVKISNDAFIVEYTGAVLATTVFLSPLAKGLFHGVIGDSGSALSVWANQKNPVPENLKVVRFIEACKDLVPPTGEPLETAKAKEILNCVKNLELPVLVQARNDYGVSMGLWSLNKMC